MERIADATVSQNWLSFFTPERYVEFSACRSAERRVKFSSCIDSSGGGEYCCRSTAHKSAMDPKISNFRKESILYWISNPEILILSQWRSWCSLFRMMDSVSRWSAAFKWRCSISFTWPKWLSFQEFLWFDSTIPSDAFPGSFGNRFFFLHLYMPVQRIAAPR